MGYEITIARQLFPWLLSYSLFSATIMVVRATDCQPYKGRWSQVTKPLLIKNAHDTPKIQNDRNDAVWRRSTRVYNFLLERFLSEFTQPHPSVRKSLISHSDAIMLRLWCELALQIGQFCQKFNITFNNGTHDRTLKFIYEYQNYLGY